MERFKNPTAESVPQELNILIDELSDLVEETLFVEDIDGTYEIENNQFSLSFTVDDSQFEIRNIDVHGNSGLGRGIIRTIHDYADEEGLSVIASNVLDTARGFWEKMGYQESGDGEYFRAE